MDVKFDLLGHPIPEARGKPGRTGHVPTPEIASQIRTLLVAGLNLDRIAVEVGLSVPTIRKHYFANGRINRRHAREMALAEARAKNLLQLQAAADDGNVSAMKEIRKIVEGEALKILDDDASARNAGRGARAVQPPGKKALAREAALEAERELEDFFDRETRLN
ncbi:MAG: hypothetical protein ACOCYW_09200 [Roseicyclus sp.]